MYGLHDLRLRYNPIQIMRFFFSLDIVCVDYISDLLNINIFQGSEMKLLLWNALHGICTYRSHVISKLW